MSALTCRAVLAVLVVLLCAPVAQAVEGLPSSPAVDALLADDWCGVPRTADAPNLTGDAPHVKVIYAYASDVGDRFGSFASTIQLYTKAAAAKVALSSDKTLRLDRGTSCGPRWLDIQTVALPHTAIAYARTADPVSPAGDIQSGHLLADQPGVNYLIFVDLGLPGIGPAAGNWEPDDTPGPTNAANLSAHSRYAWVDGGGPGFFGTGQALSQYSDAVLHEVLHNLGAVQPSAPHFSGGAHCYQLFDVMCYPPKDGTTDVYQRDCDLVSDAPDPGKALDCGSDDYFNPSPAPGSYLATHWNVYDSAFLCPVSRCAQPARAPTARLKVTANDGHTASVSAASSDDADGGVASYRWDPDGDGRYDVSAGAAITVDVADHAAHRVAVAVADNDNIASVAAITVDEHSLPDAPADPEPPDLDASGFGGTGSGVTATSVIDPSANVNLASPASHRQPTSRRPTLKLAAARRLTIKRLRERGLIVTVGASARARAVVALRYGGHTLTQLRLLASPHPRQITLRLAAAQLRLLARRRTVVLKLIISAPAAPTVTRAVAVRH